MCTYLFERGRQTGQLHAVVIAARLLLRVGLALARDGQQVGQLVALLEPQATRQSALLVNHKQRQMTCSLRAIWGQLGVN